MEAGAPFRRLRKRPPPSPAPVFPGMALAILSFFGIIPFDRHRTVPCHIAITIPRGRKPSPKRTIKTNNASHASADFTKVVGKLRPEQHGSNSAPYFGGYSLNNFEEPYRAMGFTYARTHDWPLWNPGARMVDTHFIFPLLKLDPKDPTNYYFDTTDAMIKLCQDAGSKIYYRLGTSIEHTSCDSSFHFNTLMPDDFEKYAEVLAGIVRHYTQGWANGFHYDIKHWEIWNEPDLGSRMWNGPHEKFYEFFAVVLKRLKSEFPDLQVGGPALCWPNLDYLGKILDACEKLDVKPDFVSWHCYSDDVEFIAKQPWDVRAFLDGRGYTETKLVLNEWHYLVTWQGVQSSASPELRRRTLHGPAGINEIDSAAFNLAVLSEWQKGPLDIGCYYGASVNSLTWGWYTSDNELNKSFYSMKLFGQIVHGCEDRVETECHKKGLYLLGAFSKDHEEETLLVTDYRGTDETLEIDVKGIPVESRVEVRILDDRHNIVPAAFTWHDGHLTLVKNDRNSAAFLVTSGR